MALPRRIIHIDLDAFFCAVEEQRDPSLKGKPFAVGGRPDERGVVASCSYAARAFGIRSAMPMARALRLYPELIILPGHYRDYAHASRQVMELLGSFAPVLEQISIDEAFLDLTDSPQSVETLAKVIQDRINTDLGLPCSIGLASNKLVAKIATDYGKKNSGSTNNPPNAIFGVPPGEESSFLAPLPLDALWGVGPKTASVLAEMGFKTIGDIAAAPENLLRDRFGKVGYELTLRAQGLDDRPVAQDHTVKSISQEETFPKDVRDKAQLIKIIQSMSAKISKSLLRNHLEARTIKIKVRWPDFTTLSRQLTLNQPTNEAKLIGESASGLFSQVWKPGQPVRLLGVGVSGLNPQQLRLWGEEPMQKSLEKESRLRTLLDDLHERFGESAVTLGIDREEQKGDRSEV
jgi:DNA polymerase-4